MSNRSCWFQAMSMVTLILARSGTAAQARGTGDAVEIDWQTSPLDLDLRGMNGERYVFRCNAGKPLPSRLLGSNPYTDDSSICTAAVHAGVIHAKEGGTVAIEIRPGEANYTGSQHDYLHSSDRPSAWGGSFVVLKPSSSIRP